MLVRAMFYTQHMVKQSLKNMSPQKRRMYMRRRLVALAALVVVLALVIAGIVGIVGIVHVVHSSGDSSGAVSSSSQTSSQSNKSKQSKQTSKSDKQSSSDKQASSKTDQKDDQKADDTKQQEQKNTVKNCNASNLQASLAAEPVTVGVGGTVKFKATVTYTGNSQCLIDLSNAKRVLTITSGDEVIWRSNVCPVDSRMLLMSKGASGSDESTDTSEIVWNTNRTSDTCVEDGELPHVDAGTYVAQLSFPDMKKLSSPQVPIIIQ
ncbi:hypothetical protein GCM10007377_09230 [Galliscardovia ingluviei]|uniref:Uncharacterized protein n=2 Tax=Galliscardovia ingluviei TaxID=1769422 RepID=A0A8J3AGN0_9BIFI|nr:hypothetical protein GCM10007377_09230 [Galliscardovia ingluviei]